MGVRSLLSRPGHATALVLTVASLLGCGSIGQASRLTPAQVAVKAYQAADRGEYSTADSFLSADLRAVEAQDGGSQLVWDANTRNRSLDSVVVNDSSQKAEHALVRLTLRFTSECVETSSVELVKGINGWLINRLTSDPVNLQVCGR